MKQTFIVKVRWITYGEHRIEAESETQAKVKALAADIHDAEVTGQDRQEFLEVTTESKELEWPE